MFAHQKATVRHDVSVPGSMFGIPRMLREQAPDAAEYDRSHATRLLTRAAGVPAQILRPGT
ncbi:hypothetical protein EV641_101358 [Rhodococcus sp. SMB37]|nr:hypothetical protein EV641_101358 [Rhodococcus sp. SMB37]